MLRILTSALSANYGPLTILITVGSIILDLVIFVGAIRFLFSVPTSLKKIAKHYEEDDEEEDDDEE